MQSALSVLPASRPSPPPLPQRAGIGASERGREREKQKIMILGKFYVQCVVHLCIDCTTTIIRLHSLRVCCCCCRYPRESQPQTDVLEKICRKKLGIKSRQRRLCLHLKLCRRQTYYLEVVSTVSLDELEIKLKNFLLALREDTKHCSEASVFKQSSFPPVTVS